MMQQTPRTRKLRRAFTLLEVLLAITIFAIGGVAILALFMAQTAAATRAEDLTRSEEIARMVRDGLQASLNSPAIVREINGPNGRPTLLFPLSFPMATLDEGRIDNVENRDDTYFRGSDKRTYFFELPSEPYRGRENSSKLAFTVLPKDLKDHQRRLLRKPLNSTSSSDADIIEDGINQTVDARDSAGQRFTVEFPVWYMLPTRLSLESDKVGERIDEDRREGYAFSLFIRRSVARHDKNIEGGTTGERMLAEGLYVVQLRVFKGYRGQGNDIPIEEYSFTLVAPH